MQQAQRQMVCPSELDCHERRSERRRKVFLLAKAWGVENKFEIGCTIRDVSRSGCKLESRKINLLDDNFFLAINGFTDPIRGRIVWRKGNLAGIRFIRDNGNYSSW